MQSLLSKAGFALAGASIAITGTVLAQSAGTNVFPDIEQNAFYTAAVGKFVRAGVIRGYESGYFGPHDTVTRAQVAVMLERYDESAISPLREQIEQIRSELKLGQCGDGTVQTGENCDDKNTTDGDGCSSTCQAEITGIEKPSVCDYAGKVYSIGASFPSEDGCNTCGCTTTGEVVCTLKACLPASSSSSISSGLLRCVSDTQCKNGTVCSVRYGDCDSLCNEGQTCPAMCAGTCIEPEEGDSASAQSSGVDICGDGVCSETEEEISCSLLHCEGQENCEPICGPRCAQDCGDHGAAPASSSSSSSSITSAASSASSVVGQCQQQMDTIQDFFSQEYSCSQDSDCMLFRANCPYVTCGVAIGKEAEASLRGLVEEFTDECNVSRCVSCADARAGCVQGVCKLQY